MVIALPFQYVPALLDDQHICACKSFHLHFGNFLDALSTSYAKQKEAEPLGLFIQDSSCQTIATNLMVLDIFKYIKWLILFFQMSSGSDG